MSIKRWCLGFVFSPSLRHVVMIKKAKSLHAGFWNGVGGALEDEEDYVSSMVRECREETGIITDKETWVHVGNLISPNVWTVGIFAMRDEPGFGVRPEMYHSDSWSLLESHRSGIPVFLPVNYISNLDMAPHTGVLVHASLEKLRKSKTPLISFVTTEKT